jgi:hypothetical protein
VPSPADGDRRPLNAHDDAEPEATPLRPDHSAGTCGVGGPCDPGLPGRVGPLKPRGYRVHFDCKVGRLILERYPK